MFRVFRVLGFLGFRVLGFNCVRSIGSVGCISGFRVYGFLGLALQGLGSQRVVQTMEHAASVWHDQSGPDIP